MPSPSVPDAIVLRAALAVALALGPLAAHAQVFKCVDRSGHTTYQQSPCAGGQSGGAVDLAEPLQAKPGTQRSSEKSEALWHAAARERRAVVGMPKPFVTQGLGTPSEIRAPRGGETGSEVWVYPKAGEVTRIGFQDNAVAWIRSDVAGANAEASGVPSGTNPGSRTALPVAAPADAAGEREARVREALTIGKTCTAALQDAGAPDREETLAVGQGAGVGMRYVYVFDASNANAYAAFVCLNGRVTSIERYLPGR